MHPRPRLTLSIADMNDARAIDAELLADESRFGRDAEKMVRRQLAGRGIRNQRVLEQMRSVPRHLFVGPDLQDRAYDDSPLPTRHGQTVSQPYMVACMTELLAVEPHHRVLEIGSGCGYQTMILARLADKVVSIERDEDLADIARENLRSLNVTNATVEVGDGTLGWPDRAPYDRIMVTAAAPEVPKPLQAQLADPGRMVIPIGDRGGQMLMRIDLADGRIERHSDLACRFVPLIGHAAWPD